MSDARRSNLRAWLGAAGGSRARHGSVDRPQERLDEILRLRDDVVDRFASEGEIGRGGTGTVHRAIDEVVLRRVAIKILEPPPSDVEGTENEELRRFLDEAQITGQLDHPNIPPVHEIGRDSEGVQYLVMKLVEGETLEQAIHAAEAPHLGPRRLADFLQIFLRVCEAVSFAHSRGVIHRDVKPANIMVGEFGQVHLMDWGMARLLPARSPAGPEDRRVRVSSRRVDPQGFVGTPRYMAPEQVAGSPERIDERTDVFLLGGTLYHILTGRPPYDAESWAALVGQALRCDYRTPMEIVGPDRMPAGLDHIVCKAMAPRHENRYESVEDLHEDIERFLRGDWDLETRTFRKGDVLIEQGDVGESAYLIVAGRCMAYKKTPEGERLDLREMVPGDVFGEAAILSEKPRTASVDALEEVTVMVVTRDILTRALGLNSWMGTFVRTLADRFREVDRRLEKFEGGRHED